MHSPDDTLELEADRVAAGVMMMDPRRRAGTASLPISGNAPRTDVQRHASSQSGTAQLGTSQPQHVNAALRSPGQPLGRETRRLMEPSFGRSFAHVRVHTDATGEQSARTLRAEAYTVGNDIVFGAGRFTPQTAAGQQLLAHELTHVVQQSGQSVKAVQRKEITSGVVGSLGTLAPEDWYSLDREGWEAASHAGTEKQLDQHNTFMRAAWYNTLNGRPGEYHTINERHDYYDLISYVIRNDKNTPAAAQDVRFFDATTAVTGSPGIGTVDTLIGKAKLGPETRQILRDVNAELFALNMGVIRNLLTVWKEPRDPQTPSGKISGFDFDIRMVETEQGLVESYIAKNKAKFTSAVVGDINATLDPNAFGGSLNFSQRSFEWAKKATGAAALDFTIRDHRQAIGFASVHIFHRKSEQDYLSFMKARVSALRPATPVPTP